jgi:predicted AAA+ superfamily ATPase
MCKLSKSRSFFLFGARGVGKSTLLEHWRTDQSSELYDILDPSTEIKLSSRPELILENWAAKKTEWIIIDEIQKIPKLLDVVQTGITKHKIKFALTGSSARKLRRGGANLLGGRASEYHLHPISFMELTSKFNLVQALAFGSLPEILDLPIEDKERALYSYISTYLKEEVLVEQLVRKIEPFRRFLEVAAQMNGKILNFAKIARDAGVEEKSVARYFQILDDTLIGFFLDPYHASIRKRQAQKAKFYFFDCGVTRALQNQLSIPLNEQTISYGDLFEQLVILEIFRLNDYLETRFRFSYLLTKDNVEVDLIVERPGRPHCLIEIKSSKKNEIDHAKSLLGIRDSFERPDCFVFNNTDQEMKYQDIHFLNWREGIKQIFGLNKNSL